MLLDKNKIGFIIQARTGSTRLPQKLLYKLNGETFFEILLKRFEHYKKRFPIVVATTTSSNDDIICEDVLKHDFNLFRGSEEDVLDRFICTAKKFEFNYIVRICSDNLFIDFSLLNSLLDIYFSDNVFNDYYSFSYKHSPVILTHFGVFCEIVSLSALEKLKKISNKKSDLEHVTYGIYTRPEEFKICLKDITTEFAEFEGIRLTFDTYADYLNIKEVYSSGKRNFDFRSIFQVVRDKQNILDSMSYQIDSQKK